MAAPDQQVITNREKEAIYEYSINISDQQNIKIVLAFNGGSRILRVNDHGTLKEYSLVDTKKPEDTPSELNIAGNIFLMDKELKEKLKAAIETIQ